MLATVLLVLALGAAAPAETPPKRTWRELEALDRHPADPTRKMVVTCPKCKGAGTDPTLPPVIIQEQWGRSEVAAPCAECNRKGTVEVSELEAKKILCRQFIEAAKGKLKYNRAYVDRAVRAGRKPSRQHAAAVEEYTAKVAALEAALTGMDPPPDEEEPR